MAKRRGADYWRRHLEAWRQSGLTQVAYCASQGVSLKSFCRWRGKEKDALAAAKSSLTLVPVRVGKPEAVHVVRLRSPGGWEIELPDRRASGLADLLRRLP